MKMTRQKCLDSSYEVGQVIKLHKLRGYTNYDITVVTRLHKATKLTTTK